MLGDKHVCSTICVFPESCVFEPHPSLREEVIFSGGIL